MMNMTKSLLALSLVLAIGCTSSSREPDKNASQTSAPTTTSASPTTSTAASEAKFVTYEAAVDQAKSQNKYVFVDIYTDWCTWCKKLDKDVYNNPTVQQAFAKNFTLTKINAEATTPHTFQGSQKTEEQIAEAWNVTGFPTLVFLDQTEKPVFAYIGYLSPDKFVKLLDFVSTGAFKQTDDFNGWLAKHAS
jgi:thioredoxin-related protein